MQLVGRHIGVAFGHTALNVDGAAHGIDHADEFHQHPVAGRLDDPAPVLGDLGIDEFLAMGLELAQRAFLVGAHQLAIAGDVACEYRSQPAVDTRLVHEGRPLCFHRHATGLTWPITITLNVNASGNRKELCSTLIDCLPTALGCELMEAATSVCRRFCGSS